MASNKDAMPLAKKSSKPLKEKANTNVRQKERTPTKKGEDIINKLFGNKAKLSRTDIKRFLTAVVKGEIKEFGTIAPHVDTRIKAAKTLLDIQREDDILKQSKFTADDSTAREIVINIANATAEEREKEMEEELINGNNDS